MWYSTTEYIAQYSTVQTTELFIASKYSELKMAAAVLNQQVLHFKQRPFWSHHCVSASPSPKRSHSPNSMCFSRDMVQGKYVYFMKLVTYSVINWSQNCLCAVYSPIKHTYFSLIHIFIIQKPAPYWCSETQFYTVGEKPQIGFTLYC